MTNEQRLRQHLALCRRMSDRMKRDGTWPWAQLSNRKQQEPAHSHHKSKPHGRANLERDPVPTFDNSSSDPILGIELLTVADAAAFLTISKSGMRRLQHGRHVPFVRVGGSVRFIKRDLIVFLTERRVAPLDP